MLLALAVTKSLAQTAPALPPTSEAASAEEQTVLLDPFTVTSEHEGYMATDTLGGARIRTKLADTASATSVITPKFMQDVGITNAQDLLIYTTSTEVAGLNGNFSGISSRGFGVVGAAEGTRLVNPAGVNRSRGLTAMDNTRNYFLSEIPWDGYNISRVDISRGPNSFLFGVGSPSGISNVTTNEANFKDGGSTEVKVGSFGTTRESFDYNKVLLAGELAIRLDLVNDETKYQQKPAYNHSQRAYGTLRYEPKFLRSSWSHTKIQANIETGKVDSNNPRQLPPMDYISGYFTQGMNKAGYNPFLFKQNGAGYDPSASMWASYDDIHYAWGNNATYWYDGTTGALMRASQAGVGGAKSPAGLKDPNTPNVYNIYTTGFSHYAIAANSVDATKYPGAYDRTVNYLDRTLEDPTIFDFYNKLIDGPNKHEWQRWNAFNVSVVQGFLDNRLVIQGVIDRQTYQRGQEGPLTGYVAPYISVDLNSHLLTTPSWLASGTANPNVGRPFIGSDYAGGNGATYYTQTNYQVTPAYTLNMEDLLGKTTLARNLGRHDFTTLFGRYDTKKEERTWQLYATDGAYGQASGLGLTLAQNNVNWVTYLGSSLASKTSAAGANLSNISTVIDPLSGPVTTYNSTWTAGTGVDPTSAWTNPVPTGSVTMTQSDNPANYAGYQPLYANILNSRTDKDQLYTQGSKSQQTISSSAFMYQGYLLDEMIVPQVGWRRDRVRQRGNQASIDSVTGIASMNYALSDPGAVLTTTSTSYGIAIHLPKVLKQKLPEGTDVTLYYFHGSNQTPKVRYGIDGKALPNEKGETDDYSIQFDGFKGRATLRVGAFKTIDKNAQASNGQPLGGSGWLIDSLPSWTLTMAAGGILAANNKVPAGMEGANWYWQWGKDNPAMANSIAAAIQKEFPVLFPQEYWDAYGMPVDVAAIQNGDWAHVLKNGMDPFAWNVNNSHKIHGTTPVIDQDIESKGYELEATVRPLKNWDLTFNASKVNAYQTALGSGVETYLTGMARVWLTTDVGKTAIWGGNAGSGAANQFMSGIWSPYLTQVALTGTDQPELRKWNFKTITNYTFDKGLLKGVNIGGAYRWASSAILGYGIKQDVIYGKTAWISDVNKPLRGPNDSHVDLWLGYQHKLTKKIDWRMQVNLRNAGESVGLTPISLNPDGSIAQQRIQMGQTWDLSMKFMF